MQKQALIAKVTNTVLTYRQGDLIALRGLINDIDNFRGICHDPEIGKPLIDALLDLIESEARGEFHGDFPSLFSEGMDSLMGLLEDSGNADKAGLAARSARFREKIPKGGAERAAIQPAPQTVDQELFSVFVRECEDRLTRAQEIALEFEGGKPDPAEIDELFRVFHTIKGECGFLKLASLGELAHNLESMLSPLRSGEIVPDEEFVDVLLQGVDFSSAFLAALSDGVSAEPSRVALDRYYETVGHIAGRSRPQIGEILVETGKIDERDLSSLVRGQAESGFGKRLGEFAVENRVLDEKELKESLALQSELTKKKTGLKGLEQIVRVKASKVNYLVDMVGELSIAIGQLQDSADTTGRQALGQVRKIARSLQYASMELRTEGMKALFINAKRIARDVAATLGKKVEIVSKGEDLEIDRNLIERLDEPLMHLVRNAIDHGIETAAERAAAGKDATGTLRFQAERRGNTVAISVEDDGRGLDRGFIAAKALQKGIIGEAETRSMSDAAIQSLIFRAGFSTKDKTDYISGRGVGMDIVRAAVEADKGRIEIASEKGRYTRFTVILPLTTAIIDGMHVRCGECDFIIPISSIVESVKAVPGSVSEVGAGAELMKLRDEVIPVVRIADAFRLRGGKGDIAVIVESSERTKYAFMVDRILAKREVVLKPLGPRFRDLKGIASGTVLPGGRVGLIMDVDQSIEVSRAAAAHTEKEAGEAWK